jgi:hypothetical protein
MQQNFEIKPNELMTIIINGLNQMFFKVPEADGKLLFDEILGGQSAKILNLATKSGDLDCELSLDNSEFIGDMNFDAFRSLLASHLHNAASHIKKKEPLNLFMNEEKNEIVFHMPGVVAFADHMNLMVSSVRQHKPGIIDIKLMCLDPSQFKKAT